MIRIYKYSCNNLVEIGSSGNKTHLLQDTWVLPGKDKYARSKDLLSPLQTHGKAFEEESLLTLMVETEGILNSRPLTVVNYHFHQQKFSL